MNRRCAVWQLAILGLVLLAMPTVRAAAAGATAEASIQPKAREIMRQMSDFLTGLHRFRVHVDTIAEQSLAQDLTLLLDRSSEFVVQRPDRLQVTTRGENRDLQFFYNGQTATLYSPKVNFYASWQAPATIDEVLDR